MPEKKNKEIEIKEDLGIKNKKEKIVNIKNAETGFDPEKVEAELAKKKKETGFESKTEKKEEQRIQKNSETGKKAEQGLQKNPEAAKKDEQKPEKKFEQGRAGKYKKLERVQSGIYGFDELIEGGFEKNSTILVAGSAGTGKTTFALQFLYNGAKEYNEPGILISFEESKESYYKHNAEFGWDLEKLEKEGKFRILEYKPHQVGRLLEQGGGPIKDAIQQMKAKRLVIDSITSYSLLFKDEYQQRESILRFFELIRKWDCTSIIISEMTPKEAETAKGSVGFLVDAVISLYYEKKEEKDVRVHSLEILKMRGTRHTNKVCALNFEKEGIKIYADIEIF